MQGTDSFVKTLMLGKIEGRRRRGRQRMRWLDGITDSRTGRPSVLESMGSQRVEHYWATELNWTEDEDQPLGWQLLTCHILVERQKHKLRSQWEVSECPLYERSLPLANAIMTGPMSWELFSTYVLTLNITWNIMSNYNTGPTVPTS